MWSSLGLAAIVAAAVSTAVSLLVTSGISGMQQLIMRTFRGRRATNHLLGSVGFTQDQGTRTVLMCVVRCAPSRPFATKLADRPLDYEVATELALSLAPDLPRQPALYRADEVRFQTPGPTGTIETFVSVRSIGMVEFAAPISGTAPGERPEAGMPMALEEIIGQMAALVTQVRGGLYRRLFDTRRRLDWALSVSAYVREEPTNQILAWSDLTVNGDRIEGRATNSMPESPVQTQFGANELHNVWPRTRPERIIRPALIDWLRRSGYLKPERDVDKAIARVLLPNGRVRQATAER